MTSKRIKEIQETTAYPESTSVMLALKQVWNECEQEQRVNKMEIKLSKDKSGQFVIRATVGTTDEALEVCKKEFNRRGYDTGKFTMCGNGKDIYLQRGTLSIPDSINEEE